MYKQFTVYSVYYFLLLVAKVIWYSFVYRVIIATQHFLKSSALVESMYSGMSHHERYFTLNVVTDSKRHYRPIDLLTLPRN